MNRVARALIWHELLERTRDRWVLVISGLFAMLAMGIGLYGGNGNSDMGLTGPSLVTLAGLFVPLVALVLGHDAVVGERERNTYGLLCSLPIGLMELVVAKFIGRLGALLGAVALGLGGALLLSVSGGGYILWMILPRTLLLGAAFLSMGILISTLVKRQVTAASMVVSTWFLLVFFYDLGLLGLLVITDGALSADATSYMVMANPAGLFRLDLLTSFGGQEVLSNLGLTVSLPSSMGSILIWSAWILVPLLLSGFILRRGKAS